MDATGREEYIQIGFTSLRKPGTGEFLPSVPLFIRASDGGAEAQERMIRDIGAVFAERMRAYQDGCRAAGAAI